MSKFLTGYINLEKIDAKKVFKTKSGNRCINVWVYINDDEDSYGNIGAIQQPVDNDAKKNYIGNLKNFKKKEETEQESTSESSEKSDDFPF